MFFPHIARLCTVARGEARFRLAWTPGRPASDAQIAVQQLRAGSEFGGGAAPYRSAFFEDVMAVCETQQRRDVLVHHEDRLAAFLEPRQHPPDLVTNTRRQALGRFVEQ